MATPRKPGGHVDRQELNRAIRANKDARRLIRRILRETENHRGSGRPYPILARLAQAHSIALEALTEMDRIRRREAENA